MANSMLIKVTSLVVLCLVLAVPLANATLSCDQMVQIIDPCIPHLKNAANQLVSFASEPCCNGVWTIYKNTLKEDDRRDACYCLKSRAETRGDLNEEAITALPSECGVDLPFKIDHNIDCDALGSGN